MPNPNDILGLILGGGEGQRLYPLTKQRSKPAVPLAGKYRLIDIPLSNCINSGIHRIAVLTQYNSVSLHRHINTTYNFDPFHRGWVEILAAEQTPRSTTWYQGTADAVRKQLFEIRATQIDYVLILAGDHLYRMDYAALAEYHWENKAEITVAVQPVALKDTSRYGILKRDPNGRIVDFVEKPKSSAQLNKFTRDQDTERPYLASMGIYLFNTDVLFELLQNSTVDDFGYEVIPSAIKTRCVYGFNFDGYWVDIGTIRAFFDTNLLLAQPNPPFNLYDPDRPLYTHARFLPGSVIDGATLHNVLLSEGCRVGRAEISDSVIGLRSQIQDGVYINSSIIMGADYYYPYGIHPQGDIPIGIGANCHIEGAIVDKNARLGQGVVIRPFPIGTEIDKGDYVVRDGIVVIPKSTIIPAGTTIAPSY